MDKLIRFALVIGIVFAALIQAETKTEFNSAYSFHKVPAKAFLVPSHKLSAVHGDTSTVTDSIHYRTFRTSIQTPGFVLTRSTEAKKGVDFNVFLGSGFGIAYTDLSASGTDTAETANWAVQAGCLLTGYKDSAEKTQYNVIPFIGALFVNNIVGINLGYNLGKTDYDLWNGHRLQVGINANYQITTK